MSDQLPPWQSIGDKGELVTDVVELARCLYAGKVPHETEIDRLLWSQSARMIAREFVDLDGDHRTLEIKAARLVAALAETIKIARTLNTFNTPGGPMIFEQLNRFEQMLQPRKVCTDD